MRPLFCCLLLFPAMLCAQALPHGEQRMAYLHAVEQAYSDPQGTDFSALRALFIANADSTDLLKATDQELLELNPDKPGGCLAAYAALGERRFQLLWSLAFHELALNCAEHHQDEAMASLHEALLTGVLTEARRTGVGTVSSPLKLLGVPDAMAMMSLGGYQPRMLRMSRGVGFALLLEVSGEDEQGQWQVLYVDPLSAILSFARLGPGRWNPATRHRVEGEFLHEAEAQGSSAALLMRMRQLHRDRQQLLNELVDLDEHDEVLVLALAELLLTVPPTPMLDELVDSLIDLAEQGLPQAYAWLAAMHYLGRGVDSDPDMAGKLLLRLQQKVGLAAALTRVVDYLLAMDVEHPQTQALLVRALRAGNTIAPGRWLENSRVRAALHKHSDLFDEVLARPRGIDDPMLVRMQAEQRLTAGDLDAALDHYRFLLDRDVPGVAWRYRELLARLPEQDTQLHFDLLLLGFRDWESAAAYELALALAAREPLVYAWLEELHGENSVGMAESVVNSLLSFAAFRDHLGAAYLLLAMAEDQGVTAEQIALARRPVALAAAAGDVEAMRRLAVFLRVEHPLEARQLAQSAAEAGDVEAMLLLSDMLQQGEGGRRTRRQALHWAERANAADADGAAQRVHELQRRGRAN